MFLEHNHEVDKEAMAIRDEMKAPLSSPMKAAAVKLTGRWRVEIGVKKFAS